MVSVEDVYDRTHRLVRRRVSTFLLTDELDDACQDIFVLIAEKLSSEIVENALTSWVFRIATNYCLNRIRNASKRRKLLMLYENELYPADIGTSAEDRILLEQLAGRIGPDLMEVAFYYYADGMTQVEIGELMDVSDRTVRLRLSELSELGKTLKDEL